MPKAKKTKRAKKGKYITKTERKGKIVYCAMDARGKRVKLMGCTSDRKVALKKLRARS